MCGGKDRFRFDDKDGRGTWICNQCGAGDGLALLMSVLDMGFADACFEVAKVTGTVQAEPVKVEQASPEKLREVFKASAPIKKGDPVWRYLEGRGLTDFPSMLRYGKCWEYETHRDQDAMLAVFSLADGEAVTIHRTFIKDGQKLGVKSPRKVMPPLKKMTGGAVRLYPKDAGILGIAEGIETAIACHKLFYEVPVWAALNATLLESFVPPAWAKQVWVFGDNDENYTGQKAVYTLANRLAVKEGIKVEVKIAENGDFLDDLIGGDRD